MAEFFHEGSALAELQEWSSPNSLTPPPKGFNHHKFSLLWRSAKGGLVPSWVLITFNLKSPFSSCLKSSNKDGTHNTLFSHEELTTNR